MGICTGLRDVFAFDIEHAWLSYNVYLTITYILQVAPFGRKSHSLGLVTDPGLIDLMYAVSFLVGLVASSVPPQDSQIRMHGTAFTRNQVYLEHIIPHYRCNERKINHFGSLCSGTGELSSALTPVILWGIAGKPWSFAEKGPVSKAGIGGKLHIDND